MEARPPETEWPYRYATGEELRVGDRVLWSGERALVEVVMAPDDPKRFDQLLETGGVSILTQSGSRFALEYDEVELKHFVFCMRSENDPEKSWQCDFADQKRVSGGNDSGRWRTL
jgi:hypothetical protein